MRKFIPPLLITPVFLIGFLMAGCFDAVRGSGIVEAKNYDFTGFDQVHISSAFEFEIHQADAFSITVNADDNLLDYVKVSREEDKLIIGMNVISIRGPATLKVDITMPTLSTINISGASRGIVAGFNLNERLNIIVSGACSLEMVDMSSADAEFIISGASKTTGTLNCEDIEFDISGASLTRLEGAGNNIKARISGASNLDLEQFIINDADINVDGASSSTLNINGTLNANITGASKLEYLGEPTMGSINTGIASKISKK